MDTFGKWGPCPPPAPPVPPPLRVWGGASRLQRGLGADPLVGGQNSEGWMLFVHLYTKERPKVKDVFEWTMQSKIGTFVLHNWPIVMQELDVMIVRFRPNDTNDVLVCRSNMSSVKSANVCFSVDLLILVDHWYSTALYICFCMRDHTTMSFHNFLAFLITLPCPVTQSSCSSMPGEHSKADKRTLRRNNTFHSINFFTSIWCHN